MGLTATQRTLRELRARGCHCGIVEKWNSHIKIRQDLFGIIDIIALYPKEICGIQSCGQSFSAHKDKILESEMTVEWLRSGGALQLWGWRKVKKKRGGKQMVWRARVMDFYLDGTNVIGEERKGWDETD